MTGDVIIKLRAYADQAERDADWCDSKAKCFLEGDFEHRYWVHAANTDRARASAYRTALDLIIKAEVSHDNTRA